MPKKYHVNVQNTPLDFGYLYKFRIIRGENCINCGKCTKVCIYEAHQRSEKDPRIMADPNTEVCRNCFRCIQECPRGALEKSLFSEFTNSGGEYWTPDVLLTLWKQAETGSVPVSGAGYRGPFTGKGFDSMWTDMSEIVRPTRDGIHGREYISTSVDLGRKLSHLAFKSENNLVSKLENLVTLSVPVVFDISEYNLAAEVKEAIVKAAIELDTCVIIPVDEVIKDFEKYIKNIIPRMSFAEIDNNVEIIKQTRLVSVDYSEDITGDFSSVKEKISKLGDIVTIVRVPAVNTVSDIVSKLAANGAEVIHVVADYRGSGICDSTGSDGRYIKDIIRDVHAELLNNKIRDEVTIMTSGGIALAEHVAKAMLCGADLTGIDIPLLIALGARIYEGSENSLVMPQELDKIPLSTAMQRIVNLIGTWHSQILEVMGAMGIRDIRRLRGETGRAMFFEEIDKETFGKIFNRNKQ
ncbi:MAG TPA: 4Fe-4S dicluster domain-containing protein [Dehalococcoidia bacterium]|nr:4Fe-4S dicluster domain-containing protein [Dehalococcoidia bacterium]